MSTCGGDRSSAMPRAGPRFGRPARRAAEAGVAYFGLVFAAGFLLGTLRVLVLTPNIGETVAVAFELPVMLAVSWFGCRWLVARFGVAAVLTPRLVMGGVAFSILVLAEVAVSKLAFGRSLSDHLAQYGEPSTMLGLAGQIAFAAFPAVQLSTNRR